MSRLKSSLKNMLKIFSKKVLQSKFHYVMIVRAVTLIAKKREVVAYERCRFSVERMSS